MVLVWKPITDLPENWSTLSDGELGPLLKFWNDQRSDLEQSGALATFTQRLAREWSIETGQIEGVYDLDRGITATLIDKGINADLIPAQPGQKLPEIIAAIIQDHSDVLEGLFQFIKGDRSLSKGYIHELHAALLKHQETTLVMDQFGSLFEARLVKGRYKERPNNPKRPDGSIHQYCPPEQVDSEMERLIAMHAEHEKRGVPIEVGAAWLHHRFTQIHPYQDGNGRVARALASLFFIKVGWFPVLVTRDDRTRYIEALEAADEGALQSLVSFFVDIQKRALFQGTRAATDAQQSHTVDEAIEAAKRVLTTSALDPSLWLRSKENANRLMEIVASRLTGIAESLQKEIGAIQSHFEFTLTQDAALNVLYEPTIVDDLDWDPFHQPVLPLEYRPNLHDYQRVRGLRIRAQHETFIEVNAHAIGTKFRGLIGIVTLFGGTGSPPEKTSNEIFQVNYAESYKSAERRFRPWLEESLINALTLWRKSL